MQLVSELLSMVGFQLLAMKLIHSSVNSTRQVIILLIDSPCTKPYHYAILNHYWISWANSGRKWYAYSEGTYAYGLLMSYSEIKFRDDTNNNLIFIDLHVLSYTEGRTYQKKKWFGKYIKPQIHLLL